MNLEKLTKEILSQSYNITTEAGEQLTVIESGDVFDIIKRLASDGDLADVSGISWTDSDIDAAYLMGVMNAGTFDDMNREVNRLTSMKIKPFEAVAKVRGK